MKTNTSKEKLGHVATVLMGLGHIRAAWPLRHVAKDGLILYSGRDSCSAKEFKIWNQMLKLYYFCSNAEKIPLIGKIFFDILMKIENIPAVYPKTDRSGPSIQTRSLDAMIKRGLVRALADRVQADPRPIMSAYFALSIGLDRLIPGLKNNYMLCTDSDLNRVWAPSDAATTGVKFFAPSQPVVDRLISYGVKPSSILFTGFPLPTENIGSEKNAEILKKDLFERLLRLDPRNILLGQNKHIVDAALGRRQIPPKRPDFYTIMFAIGGAGAQFEIAEDAIHSLKKKILAGKVRFILSAGTKPVIGKRFEDAVNKAGLGSAWGKGVGLVCDKEYKGYFDSFNSALRTVDILWTKPSELSFYTGLAIPVLCAPPIGPHEDCNRDWVLGMNAGMTMPAEAKYCDEWIEDMRNDGRLAWAAMNGFLRAPRNGTFIIERLLRGEK